MGKENGSNRLERESILRIAVGRDAIVRFPEIERKFAVKEIPKDLDQFPFMDIVQVYDSEGIRYRKAVSFPPDGSGLATTYTATLKHIKPNTGKVIKVEYEAEINEQIYNTAVQKSQNEGRITIFKRRFLIPDKSSGRVIHFDIFAGALEGLVVAEVEFPNRKTADKYNPPSWISKDLTIHGALSNKHISFCGLPDKFKSVLQFNHFKQVLSGNS